MTTPHLPTEGPPPVHGLVMAGGRSARMGSDKYALDLHGAPQARHCSVLLGRLVERVFISVHPGQKEDDALAGLSCIEDRYADVGPMCGVLSAMEREPGAAWLVLACDLPFLDDEALRILLDGRDRARMATTFMASDGFLEPLCAVYEPAIAPFLLQRLDEGRYSLRGVLTDCDVRMLCVPDDHMLMNVNTPEELAEVRARLAAEKAGLG